MISATITKNLLGFVTAFYIFFWITPKPSKINFSHLNYSIEAEKAKIAFLMKVKQCQKLDSIIIKYNK